MIRQLVCLAVVGFSPQLLLADVLFNIQTPGPTVTTNTTGPTLINLLIRGESTGTELGGFNTIVNVTGTSGTIIAAGVSFSPATTPTSAPFSIATNNFNGANVIASTGLADQANLVLGQNNFYNTSVSVPAGQTGTIDFGFGFAAFSTGGGFLPSTNSGASINITAVPEPSGILALAIGIAVLGSRRRRRRT